MSIVVLGDLMVDDYRVVSVDRVSPEAPCLVGFHKKSNVTLGGAGNVAANLRLLNDSFKLIGSCDIESYLPLLDKHDIKNHLLIQGQHAVKMRFVDYRSRNQLFRYDVESNLDIVYDLPSLSEFTTLLLVDYRKGLINTRNMKCLDGCSINIVSTKSKRPHTVLPSYGEQLDTAINILVVNDLEYRSLEMVWHYQYIVRTEGDRGATVFKVSEVPYQRHEENEICHIDAHRVDIFDVTGAGDTFVAVLTYCIDQYGFSEDNLILACRCANFEASLVVSKHGTTRIEPGSLDRINSLFKGGM